MKEQKEMQDLRPGYDKKWLKDPTKVVSEVLECDWCHGVARNNRELSCCGILACFGCLVQNKKCPKPKCLKPVDPFSLKKNPWANTRIKSMAAICPFAVVIEGETLCNWGQKDQKELSETDSHVNECPAVEVTCEICGVKVQRGNMMHHLEHSVPDHLLKLREQISTLSAEASEGKELKETMEKKIHVLEERFIESKEKLKIIPSEFEETKNYACKLTQDLEKSVSDHLQELKEGMENQIKELEEGFVPSKLEGIKNYAFTRFAIVCLVFLCTFIILFINIHQQNFDLKQKNRDLVESMEQTRKNLEIFQFSIEYQKFEQTKNLNDVFNHFEIQNIQEHSLKDMNSKLVSVIEQLVPYDQKFMNMDKRLQLISEQLNSGSNQDHNYEEINSKLVSVIKQLIPYDQEIKNMDERLQMISEQLNSRPYQENNLDETMNSKLAGVIEELVTYEQEVQNIDKRLELVSEQLNRRSNQEHSLEDMNSKLASVVEQLVTYDQEFRNIEKRLQLVSDQNHLPAVSSTTDSVSEQLAAFFKQNHAKLENMESKEVGYKTEPLELDSLMSKERRYIENSVAEHLFTHWRLYSVMCFLLFYLRRVTVQTLIPKFFPWLYCSKSYMAWFLNLLLDFETSSLYWLCYWHAYSELKLF